MNYLIACVALFLIGCSVQENDSKVVISYQSIETLPRQREALREIVSAFEKAHPDIRVKVQTSPSGFQKLQAQMAAGTPPDVFYYVSDRLRGMVHRGAVLDLTPFVQGDEGMPQEDYFTKVMDSCRLDGRLYCMPLHFSTDLLFYNKDIFDRMGMDYPDSDWDWDTYARVAMRLGVGQGNSIQYGTLQPRMMLLLKSMGGDCFREGQCVIDSPQSRAAIEYVQRLVESGAAPKTATLRDIEFMDGVTLFSTGRVGMLVGRTYMLAEFDKLRDFDWGISLVPRGQTRYSRLAVGGLCISSKTPHPQEAWRFVRFLAGPEGARIFARFRNAIPAMRSEALSESFLRSPPEQPEIVLQALESSGIENPGMILWQEFLDKVLEPNVEAVLFGQATPEQAIGLIRQKGELFLAEERRL